MSVGDRATRLPLLKSLKDLAKSGAKLDASIVTTFAFNGLFYEEVLLRAFERAGSRLNIVLADTRQLAESLADPLRRPGRAGVDYLLAPIPHTGAFHPKLVALLSERRPILAVGSHNVTDAGFSHNEELTAFWGTDNPSPPEALRAAVGYALQWLDAARTVPPDVLSAISGRLRDLLPSVPAAANEETSLISSSAGAPLWNQLKQQVVGAVQRVTVAGPYFDERLDFLRAIERDLAPTEIVIAVQPDTVSLTNPDRAPPTARFVDASALRAFWPKVDEVGFAHGKALAIEAEGGLVVSFGSANPTSAAWLAQARWNAEANLCLTGKAALSAFSAFGLNWLEHAPTLESTQISAIAARSKQLRAQERAREDSVGPQLIPGQIVDGGVFLAGFVVSKSGPFSWVEPDGSSWPVTLKPTEGGAIAELGGHHAVGGIHEVRSGQTTVVFVVLNDAQALRAATRPRDSARILDHLGSLENVAGLTDLLELLDKHVLAPADSGIGAGRAATVAPQIEAAQDNDVPFGPRGVSLPVEAMSGHQRPRLNDGLIADIIAALIRALGPPMPAPTRDGDAPDLDEGDADDAPSSDELAQNLDANLDVAEVDWPRLVTACRKRLTVMLKRLESRLEEAAQAGHPPSWALGRLVVVLSLLQRLRQHPPQTRDAISGRVRPTSLVSVGQLGVAFSLAVRTLYGPGRLALNLESDPGTRAADERRIVDSLLFWFAREIGGDCLQQPREGSEANHIQTRADLVPVAMSAAAYEALEHWVVQRDPWLAVWDDALSIPDDWAERHITYGLLLHQLRGQVRQASKRNPLVGDLVFWPGERDLPWVVASVSGPKVELKQPAGADVVKKVLMASVSVLDLAEILAVRNAAVA